MKVNNRKGGFGMKVGDRLYCYNSNTTEFYL